MAKFHALEFECKCGCGRNDIRPEFVAKLNELGAAYGPEPLTVSSGYRCPGHNQRVSTSGPRGPHTTGQAADLLVDRKNAHRLLGLAMAMGFTGVGVKQHGGSRFLHLDTLPDAPGQPRPTVWSYP